MDIWKNHEKPLVSEMETHEQIMHTWILNGDSLLPGWIAITCPDLVPYSSLILDKVVKRQRFGEKHTIQLLAWEIGLVRRALDYWFACCTHAY